MKPAPKMEHPGDMVALRLWLVDELSDGRPLSTAYNAADAVVTKTQTDRTMRVSGARPANQWWSHVLSKANLYYFGDEVVDLMQEVSQSVPDVMMDNALLPTEYGMLVFAKTWWGLGSDGGDVPIDGIVWGPTVVPTNPSMTDLSLASAISIGILARSSSMQQVDRLDAESVQTLGGDIWCPMGRTDYILGKKRSEHRLMDSTVETSSGENALDQDRAMGLAAWTIILQPGLSIQHDERSKAGEQAHRRSVPKKQRRHADTPPVRVIYLPEQKQHGGEATGTGTKMDHRVYVAPFWRQQPYGPASSLRRPVLVRGHIRGPEGAPLIRREVVRAKIHR